MTRTSASQPGGEGGGRGDYTYLVEQVGANATVYNNDGTVALAATSDHDVAINWALANLTADRTEKETVKLLGEFEIDNPLLIYSYTYFDLTEATITLADNTDDNMIENATPVAGNTHIEIVGGFLDGNRAGQAATSHGILIDNSTYVTVRECTAHDCLLNGIRFYNTNGTTNYSKVIYNIVYDCGREGIYNFAINYGVISGNICYSNDRSGINHAGGLGNTVSDNVCQGNVRHGILSEGGGEGTIVGNNCCINSMCGISIAGGDRWAITGNSCFGNADEGVALTAGDGMNTVTGNYIRDNYGAAGDQVRVTINGNIISSNIISVLGSGGFTGRHGVNIEGGDNNVINDNYILLNAADGIHLEGAVANVITGNRIEDNGAYGIQLDAVSTHNSIENNYTTGSVTACLRINNANCINNMISNNQFDEGDISDVGGAHNCRAWLNYDPSANVFITAINPPVTTGVGAEPLP